MANREHSWLPQQSNLHEEENGREGCLHRELARNKEGRCRPRNDNDSFQGRKNRARLSRKEMAQTCSDISLKGSQGRADHSHYRTTWHKHSKKVCETRWRSELGSASQSPSTGLFRDILGQKNRQGLLESPEPYGTQGFEG